MYIFERDAATGTWNQITRLWAADTDAGDGFGAAVAISGDALLVGAPGKYDSTMDGAAYIFRQDLFGNWNEERRFTASPSNTFGLGAAVDLQGEVALVGAFGDNAYVYRHVGLGMWNLEDTLHDPRPWTTDLFGHDVALDGDYAVVGAPQGGAPGYGKGLARLFERQSSGDWIEIDAFVGSDTQNHDAFGQALAINDKRIVAGVPRYDEGAYSTGVAYVREPTTPGGSTWHETARLTRETPTGGDNFGHAVAIDGDFILVSARRQDGPAGVNQGAVHVFGVSGGSGWAKVAEVTPTNADELAEFGRSLALDGTVAIVGAPYHTLSGSDRGMAYIYDLADLGAETVNEIVIERHAPTAPLSTRTPAGWSCTVNANGVTRVEVTCTPPATYTRLCEQIHVAGESEGAGTLSGEVHCASGAFKATTGHSASVATAQSSSSFGRVANPPVSWPLTCIGEGSATFTNWRVTCTFNP